MILIDSLRAFIGRWFGSPTLQPSAGQPSVKEDNPNAESELLYADETYNSSHLIPYDENLLEHTRTQWQLGDWESLVKIERDTLQHHPDRAKLALLAAAGHLQINNTGIARQFIRLAQDWGVSKNMISQVLVSGVYSTLGKAAVTAGDEQRALEHYKKAALVTNQKVNSSLLARTHIMRETALLDSVRQESVTVALLQPASSEFLTPAKPAVGITTYAQNFEDVMLWRALGRVENGVYIDVGAWDPVIDSVSKAFYENGWRGFHVEPLPEYADKIRQDRPDELVYQVLLGAAAGEKTFYYIPGTGLSTASKEFAERHQQAGWTIEERKYPVMTLAQLFNAAGEIEIHWLKIDVEGMEGEVLAGWGQHSARPWVVLIEATEPNSSTPTWQEWQPRLEERGYQFVYFDGLNRYYLHQSQQSLVTVFKVPPNIFDQFVTRQSQ